MSSQPIISVSGLRGIIGESLSPDLALRYAAAFAAELPAGPIVVGRDGRATGPMLAGAIAAGLEALGRNVLLAGVAATPTIGVLVRSLSAAGGIQISASHNPPEYNGIKLFGDAGHVLPAEAGARVLERFQRGELPWAMHAHLGSTQAVADPHAEHLRLVLATVDVARIRERKFRVLLDANHGAGSPLGVRLLEALGCSVNLLGGSADGLFEHTPEPTAENLAGVLGEVPKGQADIGFCQDPDADRLAVIDEQGRYLGEEYTLALCADHVLRDTPGPVVTNCSTSRMTEDIAAKYGCTFSRSKVGEAHVVDEMLARRAVLGGEGNGGVIDPRVGLVRDSFAGMALILAAMARRSLPVSALADEAPRYAIHKSKLTLAPEALPRAFESLAARFPEATVSRQDGLRLDWPGRWLLVRPSNTEPIVRIIAEAPVEAAAAELCAAAAQAMAGG